MSEKTAMGRREFLESTAGLCGDCSSCPVKCVNQWKVSDRIMDVVRLREVPADLIA